MALPVTWLFGFLTVTFLPCHFLDLLSDSDFDRLLLFASSELIFARLYPGLWPGNASWISSLPLWCMLVLVCQNHLWHLLSFRRVGMVYGRDGDVHLSVSLFISYYFSSFSSFFLIPLFLLPFLFSSIFLFSSYSCLSSFLFFSYSNFLFFFSSYSSLSSLIFFLFSSFFFFSSWRITT